MKRSELASLAYLLHLAKLHIKRFPQYLVSLRYEDIWRSRLSEKRRAFYQHRIFIYTCSRGRFFFQLFDVLFCREFFLDNFFLDNRLWLSFLWLRLWLWFLIWLGLLLFNFFYFRFLLNRFWWCLFNHFLWRFYWRLLDLFFYWWWFNRFWWLSGLGHFFYRLLRLRLYRCILRG